MALLLGPTMATAQTYITNNTTVPLEAYGDHYFFRAGATQTWDHLDGIKQGKTVKYERGIGDIHIYYGFYELTLNLDSQYSKFIITAIYDESGKKPIKLHAEHEQNQP
jgi:hypothetical protein